MVMIKIPDNMSPWKCEINGKRYVYAAGTEQEVPEEVAALIEAINANAPVADRPTAGEFPIGIEGGAMVYVNGKWTAQDGYGYDDSEGGNVEWDGVLEHAVDYVELEGGAYLVRISEEPISIEDFSTATLIIHNPDGEVFPTAEHHVNPDYITEVDGAYGYMDFVSVIPEDGEYGKKGVHTAFLNDMYCEAIILGDGSVHQIDEKYLPKSVIPAPPADDGSYTLNCTVSDGVASYAWE